MSDLTGLYGPQGFDTGSMEPPKDFELLPPGWYGAYVEETELKPTKKNDGWFLAVTFNIVSPEEFSGRKVFENMNLQNPNPKAVEIGQRALCGLGQAVGIPACPDTDLLLNKMMEMKIAIKTGKPSAAYPDPQPENVVREFRAIGTTPMTAPVTQAPPPAVIPAAVPQAIPQAIPMAAPQVAPPPVIPMAVPQVPVAPVQPVAPAAPVPAVAQPVAVPPVTVGTPPWVQ